MLTVRQIASALFVCPKDCVQPTCLIGENPIKRVDKYEILNEIKDKLDLAELPRKIETFDISNISGTNIVARNVCNCRPVK